MIKLENVSFRYGSGKNKEHSLKNISLHIGTGECIIITGESGCGKTTLTRVLNGLCPNYYDGRLTGSYYLGSEKVFGADENIGISVEISDDDYCKSLNEIGTVIGNVFQDPRSQFFCVNTTDEIVLAMENRNFTRKRMNKRLHELDELMDIHNLLDRGLFRISSGEKQKVAVAAACSVEPKVLILDEPSANLDAQGSLQLTKMLAKLKADGYTIVISEHRLSYLKDIAD